jgi:hypothetical protein
MPNPLQHDDDDDDDDIYTDEDNLITFFVYSLADLNSQGPTANSTRI